MRSGSQCATDLERPPRTQIPEISKHSRRGSITLREAEDLTELFRQSKGVTRE
jgi:hypothetical protein